MGTYGSMCLDTSSAKRLAELVSSLDISNSISPFQYHVTTIFDTDMSVKSALWKYEKIQLAIANNFKWVIFKTGYGNVLALELESETLSEVFKNRRRKGMLYNFSVYRPHITVSYEYNGEIPSIVPDFEITLINEHIEKLDRKWKIKNC